MIVKPGELTGNIRREADVAIIGSGAGGGPIAKELAEAGYSVVVLEEGGYFTREDFDFRPGQAFMRLYRDAGQTATVGLPVIIVPQGKTVGGTTTVNSGTCLRVPRHVLKRWHLECGLRDLEEDELNLLYAALEEYLFVKRADPEVVGENNLLFLRTAEKLGYSGGFLPRNAKDCEGYGVCAYGCPSGAKQSVDVSFIPDAVRAGADVYTRCRVERIVVRGGKVTGVRGHFLDPRSGRRTFRMGVDAPVVVLAGGAFQTPSLLLHNRICLSSGRVGENLSIHPCGATMALMDEPLGNPRGIPQSAYVDDFAPEGIMLEGVTLPPAIMAMTLPWGGRRHAEAMCMYSRIGTFGSMISEHDSSGRVVAGPSARQPLAFYNMGRGDVERLKRSVLLMAEVWFAAGARRVYTPLEGFKELAGARDLGRLARTRLRRAGIYGLSAYHPMGTCAMGGDPHNSVVRSSGETWEVENLFICDASVLPTSLGVNPQLTIMALAVRAAGFIDDRLSEGSIDTRNASRLDRLRNRLRREKESTIVQ
ncbi:MAG: GMC family oxidoreductase [Actinomycetota bacterium]|nr:GMC family oxidoreductase [Actinomycetota bacterium]MDD5667507.1 GMC family oxidoreductase [Actinomycetota bacterium]